MPSPRQFRPKRGNTRIESACWVERGRSRICWRWFLMRLRCESRAHRSGVRRRPGSRQEPGLHSSSHYPIPTPSSITPQSWKAKRPPERRGPAQPRCSPLPCGPCRGSRTSNVGSSWFKRRASAVAAVRLVSQVLRPFSRSCAAAVFARLNVRSPSVIDS